MSGQPDRPEARRVEVTDPVAARPYDYADAFEVREQRLQLALHFDDDRRAGAREQRRIADEHDGVAEPLLGMQQDGLATERIFAEPERLAQAAARDAGALPAPFILRETGAVVVASQQRQRLVEMREAGIIEEVSTKQGGKEYQLTVAGEDLKPIVMAMGFWPSAGLNPRYRSRISIPRC